MTADELLADLEAKAQEAEQGEWKAITKEFFGDVSSEVEVSSGTVAYDLNPDDAAFIAAANPATVLRRLPRSTERRILSLQTWRG